LCDIHKYLDLIEEQNVVFETHTAALTASNAKSPIINIKLVE
jgi:hypothetical protein